MMKCFNVYLENLLSPSRLLSVSTLSLSSSTALTVYVCARELLLLYSTCEDIRLHLKSAKHRNKYLKEFSYNMQMSTHMPALIYPHTNTHTQKPHKQAHSFTHKCAGVCECRTGELVPSFWPIFIWFSFRILWVFVIKWNENVHKFCVLLIITQRTAKCTAKLLAWCLCFVGF